MKIYWSEQTCRQEEIYWCRPSLILSIGVSHCNPVPLSVSHIFHFLTFSPIHLRTLPSMVLESVKFLGSTLSWTLRAGCVAHLIHEYVYEFTETRGESMLPTLQSHADYVHVLKKYKLGRNIDIGDCVVATKPSDPDHRVCKRITGMPGDVILIDPSSSSELTNSAGQSAAHNGFNKYIRVPDGHVWVTGDNLCHSLDSRSYSVLPMGLIRGKIVAANSMDRGLTSPEGKWWFWNFRRITNSFIEE